MKVYEAVIILKPDYDEKDKQEILNFCKNHMENISMQNWRLWKWIFYTIWVY